MQVKFSNEYSALNQTLFSRDSVGQGTRRSLNDVLDSQVTTAFAPDLAGAKQLEPSAKGIEEYLLAEEDIADLITSRDSDQDELRARFSPASAAPFLKLAAPQRISKPEESSVMTNVGLRAPEVVQATPVTIHPVTQSELKDFVSGLVEDVARKLELDPELGLAIVETESSYKPTALSRDGHASKGLFQLLDSTGKELLAQHFPERSYDPFDPQLNVELGMRHLKRMLNIFSEDTQLTNKLSTKKAANVISREKLAVAAYNAGEGRVAWAQHQVARAGGNPGDFLNVKPYLPTSTQSYVDKVQRVKSPSFPS